MDTKEAVFGTKRNQDKVDVETSTGPWGERVVGGSGLYASNDRE